MRPVRAATHLPAQAAIGLLRTYQLLISPMLGPVCRYAPSCSSYAVEAIRGRGLVVGAALAAWRVLRCNPWSKGGWDPVPPRGPHHDDDPSGRSRADLRRTPGRTP